MSTSHRPGGPASRTARRPRPLRPVAIFTEPPVAFAVAARSPCGMAKKPRPLSDDALALIAHRFSVLSEPLRLRLIHALFEGEKSVNTLVELTGGTQANVSRHLQTLTQAHILGRRKAGLQVFYSIADPSIFELCELVCGSLEKQLTRQAEVFGRTGR